jgi:hypothetical protein|nr:MAG TPA_asm: minor capsid protein [Caudoviricetes sp.]
MKDAFSLFIEDSVDISKANYDDLVYKTKRLFFDYLLEEKTTDKFAERLEKIWGKLDHSFMEQRTKELEEMIKIRDLTDREIKNKNAKYQEVYELTKMSRYKDVEDYYKKIIESFYGGNLKTVSKDYIDKESYLTKAVEYYDKIQNTIPYHNKDGTVRSWHNIADYCSMLFNTNLTRAGWNRTLYDADLLENNILYLTAHLYSCPLCIDHQGKLYSTNGTYGEIDGQKYVPKEEAIDGGVGHPNCRHQWTIYWDKDQLQEDKFNSKEWDEKYIKRQKMKAVEREINKLRNDKKIYKKIGNMEAFEKTGAKILKLIDKLDTI